MASKREFVQFISDQLREAGKITYRPMFGEYGVYCDGKLFALVCDDQLFIKITDAVKARYPELPEAPPYEGAKNYFLMEDLDNREWLTRLVVLTCQTLPAPKPKKTKGSSSHGL